MQLDWPAEEELLLEVTNTIRMRGGFSYPLFTQYVINVDILEQFAFLASEQGSKVPLDILPTSPHIQRYKLFGAYLWGGQRGLFLNHWGFCN